ncbi:hypothetical protein HELRODRAFT_178030 [Helobdella robusta]|uniref:SEA domain-containing protein n=1 Tax=Helobdella robusta TaxID=6412 RepID=T1FCM8_HELRO|nr:hypothetical protein HELRODRAFT_178030 [Helobdella robusta]ESN97594.1 hypothetical protein HELRODRAFT_178030 [Helobdella robusta]
MLQSKTLFGLIFILILSSLSDESSTFPNFSSTSPSSKSHSTSYSSSSSLSKSFFYQITTNSIRNDNSKVGLPSPSKLQTTTTTSNINRTSCPNDEMSCFVDLKFHELNSTYSQNITLYSEQFDGLPDKCRDGFSRLGSEMLHFIKRYFRDVQQRSSMTFANRCVLRFALNFVSDGKVIRKEGIEFYIKGTEKSKCRFSKRVFSTSKEVRTRR